MPVYPKALAYAQSISGSLMDGEDLVQDAILSAYSRFETSGIASVFASVLCNPPEPLPEPPQPFPAATVQAGSRAGWFAQYFGSHSKRKRRSAELGYQLTLVKELLARLSPRERDIVLLLGPAGFSPAEVARIQRTGERAVIQLAYRARRKLKRMLPEDALPFLHVPAAGVSHHD